jgi:SDR family mycofactocin-dependent oxidoreductase
MGRLAGRVAFITGAARGQGRSHAVRLAQDGADIIAVDICEQIDTVPYPLSTWADLEETAGLVKAAGRRIISIRADVRNASALGNAVLEGTAQVGPVDIVIANAGIGIVPLPDVEPDEAREFRDIVEVNLFGAWNTVHAAAPGMIERGKGGSIVLTSSTQGLSGRGGNGSAANAAYAASKHGIVGLMRTCANWLAPHMIRVNSIHPTGVDTPMINNAATARWMTENAGAQAIVTNLMPVDMVSPDDISNAVAWLVSDEARFVTGVTLPVDAGFTAK